MAPHTPAGHWGPPQRDETIRPPTATLIGWHRTRTCGWAVPTFRVTCVLSFALMRNIPEVQALVTLSPHLDQQILATEAHDIKGTLSSVWEPWSPEPMLLISSHWSRKDGLKVELGAGL